MTSRTRAATLLAYAAPSFGIQAVWGTLAAFAPLSLEGAGASPAQVGLVLALVPLAAIVAQPVVSTMSDRTRWRLGRRRPYLGGGALVAAAGLALLAMAAGIAQQAIGLVLVSLGLYGALGPYRALMADTLPATDHLTATGLQAAARALGLIIVVAFAASAAAYWASAPYVLAAAALLLSSAWAVVAVREQPGAASATRRGGAWAAIRRDSNVRTLFVAHFLWWLGFQGPVQFLSLFVRHDLHRAEIQAAADAASLLTIAGVVGLLLALPIGRMARRVGSVRTLVGGLALAAAGLAVGVRATTVGQMRAIVMLFGVGYTCVQVVPYTLLVRRQPPERAGALAGAFQLLITVPQVIATAGLGAIAEQTGSYRFVMPVSALCVLASMAVVSRVSEK